MATLTGKTIADTYKDLLQVSNANSGIDGTLRTVQDGEGTNSALQLSNSTVNINGTFQLNGGTLTATASALNAVTDLSGVTGLVAMSGGSPNGRSIAVGTGLSVTNADGTAGNPTIQLDSTPVVSGSYGPVVKFDVNQKGQIVSASTPVSVSIATVRTSELVASILHVTSDVSVNGNVVVSGGLEVISDVSANAVYATSINSDVIDANVINVSVLNYSLVSTTSFTVNNLTVVSKVSGNNATFSGIVSASSFYGDGSNLTNLPTAPVSVSVYTVNVLTVVSAATVNGIISAANFVGDGAGLTNVSAIFAASATNATNAVSAVFAASATNATNAVSATFATSATNATNAVNATSAVFASSATNATNAVNATNVTGSGIVSAASAVFTGIVSANEIDASIANFNGNVSVNGALNVVGAVSGTSAIFTGVVSVSVLDAVTGDFSGRVSVSALNVSGPVSGTSAIFTGVVSVNEIDASIANFNGAVSVGSSLNVVGTISGTNAVFTGSVSVSSTIAVGAGTVGAPSLTTTGDPNTGIWFPAADILAASTNGTERMRINSSGNVGIGTSSPNVLLNLAGSSTTALARIANTGNGASAFDGSGAGLELLATGMNLTSKYTPAIKFGSTDTDFTTTNPKFGAALVATAVQTYSSDTTGGMNLEFWTAPANPGTGSGLVERMRIDSSGNVGIGTASPAGKLQVVGNTLSSNFYNGSGTASTGTFGADSGGTGASIIMYGSTGANPGAMLLYAGSSERMRIDSSGNVGIGTAGPTRTLDVVGTASFTGVVSVSSVAFGTSNLGKKIAVSGAAIATIVSLTDGTSISVDFNTSQNFAVMLTGNRTLESPSNCVAGQTGSIFIMQNVSGGKTLSFGSNWKFAAGTAPTLTTTASAVDRLDYIVFSSTAIHTVATLDVR